MHPISSDPLQRQLGGQLRSETQLDKVACSGANLSVLGQVAPGLPH